jgi:oligosaccharide repeat unit polymerase
MTNFIDFFSLIFLPFLVLFFIGVPLFIRGKTDLFSIWSWIFYSSILGILLRCIAIYFNWPTFSDVDRVFLLGQSKSFMFSSILLIFFGVLSMVLGYTSINKSIRLKAKIFRYHIWDVNRFFYVSIVLMLISLYSLFVFIDLQGGLFSVESMSSYRGVSDTLSELSSHSYLRLFISFSSINLYLNTVWIILYKEKRLLSFFLWMVSFFTFIFFNFFVSQRGAIVFGLIQMIAINYYLNEFQLPKFKLFIGFLVGLGIFQVMSEIRNFNVVDSKEVDFSILKAIEPAILTTNMIDVSKTAHILDAIPDKLSYQYGSTLTTIFISWIPREFWREKPVTNVDNIIGMEVFGASNFGSGGVPPGIFAELYWNFWIPGVIFGCFLLGVFLKISYQTFLNNIKNPNVVLIYVTNFMLIGLAFIGSSFSSVLIGVLQILIPTIFILKLITKTSLHK